MKAVVVGTVVTYKSDMTDWPFWLRNVIWTSHDDLPMKGLGKSCKPAIWVDLNGFQVPGVVTQGLAEYYLFTDYAQRDDIDGETAMLLGAQFARNSFHF